MPRGMIETLCTGSMPGSDTRDQRVPHLVIGDDLALLGIEQPIALFQTRDDPFDRVGEIGHRHGIGAAARRQQRRLVDEIGEVGAGEARRQRSDLFRIDVAASFTLRQVDAQDLDAALLVRAGRPAPGGRSGRRAAAPGREFPGGWWRRESPGRCAHRSRPSRPGAD